MKSTETQPTLNAPKPLRELLSKVQADESIPEWMRKLIFGSMPEYMSLEDIRQRVLGGQPGNAKTLYSWIKNYGFPRGKALAGGRIVLYRTAAVLEWVARQPDSFAGKNTQAGLDPKERRKRLRSLQSANAQASRDAAQGVH